MSLRRIGAFLLLLMAQFAYAQQTVGLFKQTQGSQDGYVLFAPVTSKTTYLIDKCGRKVHTWHSDDLPGVGVRLMEDGSLLRGCNFENSYFRAGGAGGRIEMLDWNSNVKWRYQIANADQCQHHDVNYLPNGNILAIVWKRKSRTESLDAGRRRALVGIEGVWSESVLELKPIGTDSAEIVWEWSVWDHLIQDNDSTKANFGIVADHPELVDLNFPSIDSTADWLHMNSVSYNPALDQIVVSIHTFSEIWVIDHSTTTAQAASHSGGLQGHGGDILYRWGNPVAYRRGTSADQTLFYQHDPYWIEPGLRDAGKIMVFNNGWNRPNSEYSTIDVIPPPVTPSGGYDLSPRFPFAPAAPSWQYKAANPPDFYSRFVSGAQRLSSGNTLICSGSIGTMFEIDGSDSIVWKYVNPVDRGDTILTQGQRPVLNTVFRSPFYEPTYAGFAGRTLIPGDPIEGNPNPTLPICIAASTQGQAPASIRITAANPFGKNLSVTASQPMDRAEITLTSMTGTVCQTWKRTSLPAGEAVSLPIGQPLAPGAYVLTVRAGSFQKTMLMVRQN